MQKIVGAMRRAIEEYQMIQAGDGVVVGVSGGKDSMVLLEGLARLREHTNTPFTLKAATVDPQFSGKPTDFSAVEALCRSYGIEYSIKRSDLAEIIFEARKEKNPCSLCARMRRGILHTMVKELGCNKLALGHHADDAVETFMMNLTQEGRIGCFRPVTYLSRKEITMIRPLALLTEKQVEYAAMRTGLTIIKSGCPVDGATQREAMKTWLHALEQEQFPGLKKQVFGAMRRARLDGWGE